MKSKQIPANQPEPPYRLRWLSHQQYLELCGLYQLSKAALVGENRSEYHRRIWACKEFHKQYPHISECAAYKDFDGSAELGLDEWFYIEKIKN